MSVESLMPNLIKRKIKIENLQEEESEARFVIHLQYLAWPDHGAPDESDHKIISKILEFIREYHQRSKANNDENKIIVHCSAGIGRSGTIISIYNI
jgi:protein tyrosine phosphatase